MTWTSDSGGRAVGSSVDTVTRLWDECSRGSFLGSVRSYVLRNVDIAVGPITRCCGLFPQE